MIKPLDESHISQIVRLHQESLKGDFLTSLGEKVLSEIYKGVVGSSNSISFICLDKNKVTGFVVGTRNMQSFFKEIFKKRFLGLALFTVLKFLRKPYIIKCLLETLSYTGRETGPKAELVVIAVKKNYRGQNLGRKLVKSLENNFRKLKIKKYKVNVHADKKANHFYKRLGFTKISSFNLYNKEWLIYEKKIGVKNT